MDSKKVLVFINKAKIIIIFMVMCIILSILAPSFLSGTNIINVIRQISIICIISMGLMLIIITGGIDLSPGSVAAVSGVAAALFATQFDGPVVLALLVGLLVGGGCGLFNGIIVAKGKIPAFIVTLGMSEIARGIAYVISDGKPISGIPKEFRAIGRSSIAGVPVPIVIMMIILIVTYILTRKLIVGKHIYAVGGNQNAARVSGINVDRILILVYTYAGLMAGLGGLVLTARISTGHPNSANGYELDAIAATVIGGTSLSTGGIGSVFGTLIGALIIGVLNNGLDIMGVSAYYQQIAKGLIIIITVLMDRKTTN